MDFINHLFLYIFQSLKEISESVRIVMIVGTCLSPQTSPINHLKAKAILGPKPVVLLKLPPAHQLAPMYLILLKSEGRSRGEVMDGLISNRWV